MNMSDWAEKEVEIACEREKSHGEEEGDWEYGCACYHSALKAYRSLMEDGHSGFSISLTKQILDRLIDGEPLTPIEDTDDVWNERPNYNTKKQVKKYQCSRMSSLFKYVYPDGTVKYSDVDRVICYNVDSPWATYHNGFIINLIDEMYPIKMPYSGERMRVECETFLTDPKNGDYDTKGVLCIHFSDGTMRTVNRYFKESEDSFVEINKLEYLDRKFAAKKLKDSEGEK